MTKKYCTYLTTYFGNQLPPFYIGYTSVEKINHGYRGSVRSRKYKEMWRRELKEHPELFNTTILTIHETTQEANNKELFFQKKLDVIHNPLYVNQSCLPHLIARGYKHSLETKRKMSEKRKIRVGVLAPCYGKHCSEETKRKLSLKNKGRKHSPEAIFKIKHTKRKARNTKGKTYEEIHGPELAKILKAKRSESNRNRWKT